SMAKNSIARTSKALSLELSQVIEQIRFFKRQIAFLDRQIAAMVAEINTPLLTIPGIGFRTAAVILAEIGDIRRFKKPDQLQAFAGLDPSTYQSGKFNAANTPMVKHGSTYLRWSLMQAARLCSIHCRDFRNYMEHKIAQGKHYFVALGHLSKKLIRVIFHMLYTNEVFVSMAA
ncbi:transposase, partial [Cloacibacillus porcorum]